MSERRRGARRALRLRARRARHCDVHACTARGAAHENGHADGRREWARRSVPVHVETGPGGNPHLHGMAYGLRGPRMDDVIQQPSPKEPSKSATAAAAVAAAAATLSAA